MASLGSARSSFRGIDTTGLRDLARHAESCAAHLNVQAAHAKSLANATATPLLSQVADRLGRASAGLTTWSRSVEYRIVTMERVRSAATEVLSTVVTALAIGATSALDTRGQEPLLRLGLADAYRRADAVLLDDALSSDARQRRLQALVFGLSGAEVLQLADMLVGGGHDLRAVGTLGAAAAALPWPSMRGVLDASEAGLERGDLTSSVFAGRLVADVRAPTRDDVAYWLADHPVLVPAVVRGAAVSAASADRPEEKLRQVASVLAELDDAARIAAVVVELILAQQESVPLADRIVLDQAIGTLIGVNPRAVVAQLATVADPDGLAMVPWMQHLIGVERGPDLLGRMVAGVAGPAQMESRWFADPGVDRRFENAGAAAYLATSLAIAVERVARDARSEIAGVASAAATVEILIPVVGRATRAIEVLVPAGLTFGVGTAARAADRRIGGSLRDVLERIAERFEVPANSTSVELARALDVFDERRDALVAHWSERP